MKRDSQKRRTRKIELAAEDIKQLSDELRSSGPTYQTALLRITEALIILLEDKNEKR
jgi:hypothetical protein